MAHARFIELVIISLAIFGTRYLVDCEIFTESEQSAIDETIQELMSCKNIPGLGVSVAKNDKSFAKGYGLADVENEVAMTEDTLMCIGSTTKAFTSVLLAILITENNKQGGTYSWATTLREIFGDDFNLTSDPVISSQVTLADLLSHRSGVASVDALLMVQKYTVENGKNLLERLHLLPKKGLFRGQFSYNNLMYGLAGLAAESLGKKPYLELLNEKIFDPLGISSAVMIDDLDFSQNLTGKPYLMINGKVTKGDTKFYRLGAFSPAGGLCLSSSDFTKWLHFLISYGRTSTSQSLVGSITFVEMIYPQMTLDFMTQLGFGLFEQYPETSITSWYGLGWFGRFYRGNIDFFHGGSMFSYSSAVVIDPIKSTGIAVTQNGLYPIALKMDLYPLAYYLKDILEGHTPWLNKSSICSFPEPWQTAYRVPPPEQNAVDKYEGETANFTGTFYHILYGEVVVEEIDASLYFMWGNIIKGALYDVKNLQFKLRMEDDTYRILGYELGSISVIFSEEITGQYNKVEIKFSKVMEAYDFSRQVLFNSSSSSASKLNLYTAELTLLCSIFLILANIYS